MERLAGLAEEVRSLAEPHDARREVMPSARTRTQLATILRRFREQGTDAPPVFFGNHRKPEGVLLSYEKYIQLLDHLDELALALRLRETLQSAPNEIVELEDLARQGGLDLSDSGSGASDSRHEQGSGRISGSSVEDVDVERNPSAVEAEGTAGLRPSTR
jgi:hypothetical protein